MHSTALRRTSPSGTAEFALPGQTAFSFSRLQEFTVERRIGPFDLALIMIFLAGLYTNYTIMVTAKVQAMQWTGFGQGAKVR